jgi:hypothetical protein
MLGVEAHKGGYDGKAPINSPLRSRTNVVASLVLYDPAYVSEPTNLPMAFKD